MKLKKLLSALLASALILTSTGCTGGNENSIGDSTTAATSSASDKTEENNSTNKTIVDHLDKTVEIPDKIERIAVCNIYPLPSVLSVFFDSAEKIVGMAAPSMSAAKNSLLSQLYPEILNAETGFIDGTEVNTEELMKLKPDIVFYGTESPELGEKLTAAGFCAVAVSASKWKYNAIETLDNWIKLLDEIFPENTKYKKVSDYSNEIYSKVQDRVKDLSESEKRKVFFLFQYSDSSITTSGKLFFGEWWAEAIGAVNVGAELETDNSTAVNMEQIYSWNPSLIFMTNFNTSQPEDLYTNTVGSYDWSGIDAVSNKQVYKMPLGMYRSYTPGVDTPITLLWLAKTTYPDLFDDINITEEVKSYYNEIFGIILTDEQADMIFTPVSEAGANVNLAN